MISKLPNAETYDNFAYHVSLLKDFVRGDGNGGGGSDSTRSYRGRRGSSLRGGSFRGGGFLNRSSHNKPTKDSSVHSAGSFRGTSSSAMRNNSFTGGKDGGAGMSRSASMAAFIQAR